MVRLGARPRKTPLGPYDAKSIWNIRRFPATPPATTALSAIGTSRVAHLIRLADRTSDSPFDVVEPVTELFTEICRLRGDAEGMRCAAKHLTGAKFRPRISHWDQAGSHCTCDASSSLNVCCLLQQGEGSSPFTFTSPCTTTASAGTTGRDLTRVLHRSVTPVASE